MFVPPVYQEHDLAIQHALIEEIRLGTLITAGAEKGIVGSHIPFMLDASRGTFGTLIGHVDRRNAQWRALQEGAEVLVTFLGPDSSVAAGWYGSKPPCALPGSMSPCMPMGARLWSATPRRCAAWWWT